MWLITSMFSSTSSLCFLGIKALLLFLLKLSSGFCAWHCCLIVFSIFTGRCDMIFQDFILATVFLQFTRFTTCHCFLFLLLCFDYLSSGDRVVVVIVLSVMSMNSSPLDPIISGIGVVLWEQFYVFCKKKGTQLDMCNFCLSQKRKTCIAAVVVRLSCWCRIW